MTSPTVRQLTPADIARLVQLSFGPAVGLRACAPLAGGGFAGVWSVTLTDGRTLVLKASPPASARLLRYETSLVDAEATYFRLVRDRLPGVPVPDVIQHGSDPALGAWLFTSLLPGTALPQLDDRSDKAPVRYALGAAVATIHQVSGDGYGYSGDRPHGEDWPSAFTAMVEALLADAADWQLDLGDRTGRIRAAVASSAEILQLPRPALLHFDLWDGNVLATVEEGTARLTGLVDGERWLYGDPLVDFVSAALFRRIEDEPDHPFLAGYRSVSGSDPLTGYAVSRLRLYRLFLALLMVVEQPSRGQAGPESADRSGRLWSLLDGYLSDVEAGDADH